jgi:hypothetical protein
VTKSEAEARVEDLDAKLASLATDPDLRQSLAVALSLCEVALRNKKPEGIKPLVKVLLRVVHLA